jgi:aarF domain-containing kinase
VEQRSRFDRFMDSISAGARLIWLLCLFLPLIVATPFALQWGYLPRAWWMQLLRGTLEAAGPAFIKWGQWAATRHDLFPPDMCSALEALHASAPAHSAHYTTTIIHRSFGLPASDLFEWLDPEPMASGSIGQIHRARLSRQGALLTGG